MDKNIGLSFRRVSGRCYFFEQVPFKPELRQLEQQKVVEPMKFGKNCSQILKNNLVIDFLTYCIIIIVILIKVYYREYYINIISKLKIFP